jgi:ABC-type bacteriocin/lantibiotic exporter with double-glycine peptidase domain
MTAEVSRTRVGRPIFREAALDRLATPESLDQLVALVPPHPLENLRRAARVASAWLRRGPRRIAARRVRTPTVLQMDATECGAAALAMVLGSFGRVVSLEELREACGVSRDGSKASSLLKVAREHGLLAKGFTKEIDALASLPLPLIAFWNFNHFVVVEGFGPESVYLNDPASGRRQIAPADFDAAFTGVVLVFERSPDFRPGGGKPGLWPALRNRLLGSEWALLGLVLASLALLVPGVVLPVVNRRFRGSRARPA